MSPNDPDKDSTSPPQGSRISPERLEWLDRTFGPGALLNHKIGSFAEKLGLAPPLSDFLCSIVELAYSEGARGGERRCEAKSLDDFHENEKAIREAAPVGHSAHEKEHGPTGTSMEEYNRVEDARGRTRSRKGIDMVNPGYAPPVRDLVFNMSDEDNCAVFIREARGLPGVDDGDLCAAFELEPQCVAAFTETLRLLNITPQIGEGERGKAFRQIADIIARMYDRASVKFNARLREKEDEMDRMEKDHDEDKTVPGLTHALRELVSEDRLCVRASLVVSGDGDSFVVERACAEALEDAGRKARNVMGEELP